MLSMTRRMFLLIAFSITVAGCSNNSPEEQAKEAVDAAAANEKQEKDDVFGAAQQMVDDHLKSPGSAKYPDFDASFVTITSPNNYSVTSFVDSQNNFGALIRSNWAVKMHRDNVDKASFHLDDITITER